MLFALTTLTGLGVVLWRFDSAQKALLLPGQTTAGHHQIELECGACHTAMMGVKTDSCVDCHGAELAIADDSHPASKFRDPRNADRLQRLDAMDCVTCHVEHRSGSTRAMGVTQPRDYCLHCHDDIAEERPTHAGLGFQTCASAGCHNFHDNRALHEDFLEAHLGDPVHLATQRLPARPEPHREVGVALTATQHDAPAARATPGAVGQWAASAHAAAGVNCMGCHAVGAAEGPTDATDAADAWVASPSLEVCGHCHGVQQAGFQGGKHGMRLAAGLPAMRPALARLPMKAQASERKLGCGSCHSGHGYDRDQAAVEACLGCHDDTHSRAYRGSPHYQRLLAERRGEAPAGSGVSCASCHLPRDNHPDTGERFVQHNQNDNLRPNEKMLRPVCAKCHGVAFSLDALADRALIERNFAGMPSVHVRSMDLLREKIGRPARPAAPQP